MAWVNGPEQRQSETLLEFQSHGYETEACHRSHLARFSGTPYQAHKTTAGEHGSSFSTEVTVMVPQHGGERSSRSTATLMRSDCKLHESRALPVFLQLHVQCLKYLLKEEKITSYIKPATQGKMKTAQKSQNGSTKLRETGDGSWL